MVLEQLGSSLEKEDLDLFLISYTRIDSKWVRDLNVKNETIWEKNPGDSSFISVKGKRLSNHDSEFRGNIVNDQ